MISGYSDHSANERTFLAWVRTGIAVIAFGFVIEKFNLFVLAIASSTSSEAAHRLQLDQLQLESLSGPLGRYDGLALMLGGLVLIVIATARFVRTGRRLDDPETHPATSIRVELISCSLGAGARRLRDALPRHCRLDATSRAAPRLRPDLPAALAAGVAGDRSFATRAASST
jgi:inner membrane protein YidH